MPRGLLAAERTICVFLHIEDAVRIDSCYIVSNVARNCNHEQPQDDKAAPLHAMLRIVAAVSVNHGGLEEH